MYGIARTEFYGDSILQFILILPFTVNSTQKFSLQDIQCTKHVWTYVLDVLEQFDHGRVEQVVLPAVSYERVHHEFE